MGDVVNLRRFRKAKARDDAGKAAAENRVRHGQTKSQRETARQDTARETRHHEDHRLGGEE